MRLDIMTVIELTILVSSFYFITGGQWLISPVATTQAGR